MTEKPKLPHHIRQLIRLKNNSSCELRASVSWIKRYILYHFKRHLSETGKPEVEAFLTHHLESGYDIRAFCNY